MLSSCIIKQTNISQYDKCWKDYKMYYGDANLINTELQRYLAVTKDDIKNAAIKYYNNNNRVVLHYLPKPVNP